MNYSRILGIDYGDKRVGLALSDPLGITAQGIDTQSDLTLNVLIQTIQKICTENHVSEIVVGLPINMNGTMGPRSQKVMDFAAQLEKVVSIPVKTWDERLTSRQADRLMIQEGLSRQKQKKQSDRMAATLILQSYLDFKRG